MNLVHCDIMRSKKISELGDSCITAIGAVKDKNGAPSSLGVRGVKRDQFRISVLIL